MPLSMVLYLSLSLLPLRLFPSILFRNVVPGHQVLAVQLMTIVCPKQIETEPSWMLLRTMTMRMARLSPLFFFLLLLLSGDSAQHRW